MWLQVVKLDTPMGIRVSAKFSGRDICGYTGFTSDIRITKIPEVDLVISYLRDICMTNDMAGISSTTFSSVREASAYEADNEIPYPFSDDIDKMLVRCDQLEPLSLWKTPHAIRFKHSGHEILVAMATGPYSGRRVKVVSRVYPNGAKSPLSLWKDMAPNLRGSFIKDATLSLGKAVERLSKDYGQMQLSVSHASDVEMMMANFSWEGDEDLYQLLLQAEEQEDRAEKKSLEGDTYDNGLMKKKETKRECLSVLDPYAIQQIARVGKFGAEKYDAHNYRKGGPASYLLDAAYRHIMAWQQGEDIDPDSGESHLAHGAWNLCALMSWNNDGVLEDDRYKREG